MAGPAASLRGPWLFRRGSACPQGGTHDLQRQEYQRGGLMIAVNCGKRLMQSVALLFDLAVGFILLAPPARAPSPSIRITTTGTTVTSSLTRRAARIPSGPDSHRRHEEGKTT